MVGWGRLVERRKKLFRTRWETEQLMEECEGV